MIGSVLGFRGKKDSCSLRCCLDLSIALTPEQGVTVKSHIVLAKDPSQEAYNHLYVVLALGDLFPPSVGI